MFRLSGKGASVRGRLYIFSSVAYMVLGVIIAVRSIAAHVVPIAVLGVVFIALGGVRLRDWMIARDRS